ncbi:MAG TPA: metallophosphoesterase family protein [Candidatus Angelobacter sp.]|nr:metallophosphoesterase family protein [Candidatus Angelobacter sp.]
MRILILSDIHANLEALEACLEAAPAHDHVFNLGDIVGYGANPNEVTDKSRSLGKVFVRGNHDKACSGVSSVEDFNPVAGMAALWTREHLTEANLEFLKQLPHGPIAPAENLICVHGSPRDEDEYVLFPRDAYAILARAEAPLTFFGHTHVQGAYWIDDSNDTEGNIEPRYKSKTGKQTFTFRVAPGARCLVNPGSVGQPRDSDPRAAFASYDTEAGVVTFHRVPYDIHRAQKKILAAGLPERLAFRLEEGR